MSRARAEAVAADPAATEALAAEQERPDIERQRADLARLAAEAEERVRSLAQAPAPPVSPPGGDFSEPVTQACMRVAGALWALDADLAHQRQFPAVDWHASYSLYAGAAERWFAQEVDPRWPALRAQTLALLQRDAELREVAAFVGPDALEDADRLTLAGAAAVRELVLGQSAFDPEDAFCAPAGSLLRVRRTLDEREREEAVRLRHIAVQTRNAR